MSAIPEHRAKLIILAGFLGSGKTTWLRHQLHIGAFRNAAVIVNEAAAAPIDDALLADVADVTVVPGGCACCSKRDAFLECLMELCDRRTRGERQGTFDAIVLETSGLANPAAIVAMIRDHPVLVHHILVEEVIVTVDAIHALALLRTELLVRRQVQHAHRLIVTKLDGIAADTAAALCATMQGLNPGAQIRGSIKGETASLPDFDQSLARSLPPLEGLDDQRPILAADIGIDPAIEWPVFSIWLSALLHARGDDLYRVKGVVRTPTGRVLLQCVQKSILQPQLLPDVQEDVESGFDNRLAFIGRGFEPSRLERSLKHFCA